jgi:hypothetical protein
LEKTKVLKLVNNKVAKWEIKKVEMLEKLKDYRMG